MTYKALQRFWEARMRNSAATPKKRARQRHWYTRYHLSEMAVRMFGAEGGTLPEGLQDHQLKQCLDRVHVVLRKNPELQRNVALGAGPATVAEFRQDEAKRAYNGKSGGQFFKWFCPSIFERELKRLRPDAHRGTCTEWEAMRALRSTTQRLHHRHFTSQLFKPYTGPQCFPQLVCTSNGVCVCTPRVSWAFVCRRPAGSLASIDRARLCPHRRSRPIAPPSSVSPTAALYPRATSGSGVLTLPTARPLSVSAPLSTVR